MNNSRTLADKRLYKLLITCIKFIPITMLILFVIGLGLNYIGKPAFIILCVCGTSIIFLILLYLLSFVFRFCYLYRLPLHYITISNVILICCKLKIIIYTIFIYRLLAIILGLFIIMYITYWYKNRHTPKKDPIYELCKTYCCK